MAKRKPYRITYPERESRDAVSLRVSGINERFSRWEPTKVLPITDHEAAALRRDGWTVEAESASEPVVATSASSAPTEPRPRRRARREG